MFELIFTVGITLAGAVAALWFLRRDAKNDDPCGGCVCRNKDLLTGIRDIKEAE